MFGAPMAMPSPRQPVTSAASFVLLVMTCPQVTTSGAPGSSRSGGGGVSAASKRSSSSGSVISGGSCGCSLEMKLWSPPFSTSSSVASRITQPKFGNEPTKIASTCALTSNSR
jgi:hypothetical protein